MSFLAELEQVMKEIDLSHKSTFDKIKDIKGLLKIDISKMPVGDIDKLYRYIIAVEKAIAVT